MVRSSSLAGLSGTLYLAGGVTCCREYDGAYHPTDTVSVAAVDFALARMWRCAAIRFGAPDSEMTIGSYR